MEVDSFDIFRVCETKVWADPEYFVLGSLSGDRRGSKHSRASLGSGGGDTVTAPPLGQIDNQAFKFFLILTIL